MSNPRRHPLSSKLNRAYRKNPAQRKMPGKRHRPNLLSRGIALAPSIVRNDDPAATTLVAANQPNRPRSGSTTPGPARFPPYPLMNRFRQNALQRHTTSDFNLGLNTISPRQYWISLDRLVTEIDATTALRQEFPVAPDSDVRRTARILVTNGIAALIELRATPKRNRDLSIEDIEKFGPPTQI